MCWLSQVSREIRGSISTNRKGEWAGFGVVPPPLLSAGAHTCAHSVVCVSWDCSAPLPMLKSSFSPWSGWSLFSGFSPSFFPPSLHFPCPLPSPSLPFTSLCCSGCSRTCTFPSLLGAWILRDGSISCLIYTKHSTSSS